MGEREINTDSKVYPRTTQSKLQEQDPTDLPQNFGSPWAPELHLLHPKGRHMREHGNQSFQNHGS